MREDFPLRGFVECGDCGRPLTSCFSKSAAGVQHPYYRCYHRPCEGYGKSIRRDHLEGEFETMLKAMQPSTPMFEIAKAMFKDAWSQRTEQSKKIMDGIRQQIDSLEKQIAQLVDRVVDSDNDTVVKAYERKITELEKNKRLANQKLQNRGKPTHTFDEMFELAMRFLSSPWNIWAKGDLTMKKMVLRLAFTARISYDRKTDSLNAMLPSTICAVLFQRIYTVHSLRHLPSAKAQSASNSFSHSV